MAEKLGTILLRRGLITDAQLAKALLEQKRHGGRLGDILVSGGIIGYYQLYQAVADHYELHFVDLLKDPPDPALFTGITAADCLKFRAVPWRENDGRVIVAIADPSDATLEWIMQQFGMKAALACTSPFDIRRAVEIHYGSRLEEYSRLSLWKQNPGASARVTVPRHQREIFFGLGMLFLCVIAVAPLHAMLAIIFFCHIAYGATMAFKCITFAHGAGVPTTWNWRNRLERIDEKSLPLYTVLVPMYRETESLPGLLAAMQRLDYPASKLDIKLVLEADDHETYAAACALKPHYCFDIVRVPPSEPRTKPKACNYALRFARGEIVTVYDADDRPDRLQLKKTVVAFSLLPPDVACLQARLNYYNANDNMLTRFFSLEYTMLFHFMLYGLSRIGIPIPLGGTSNHLHLARLKELGEWDPFNVTEDADLGVRLSSRGLRTLMLDSYTMEEAPNQLMPWIRQRSRWIKGYMQTWLVHMRDPGRLWRTSGWKGFFGFQFFVGLSCFTFLTAPLVLALSLLWIGDLPAQHQVWFPKWLLILSLGNLMTNVVMHWCLALYCALTYRRYRMEMIFTALLYPLYLILHSVASYRALWQLIVKPHLWEKTMHGLAKRIDTLGEQGEGLAVRR